MPRITPFARLCTVALWSLLNPVAVSATPQVVLISLDGAQASRLDRYLADGTLNASQGLGLLKSRGIVATRNLTVSPSLTAVSHIAIATGSSAPKNDVPANSFHLLASPFSRNTSGFAAPIGGYSIDGPMETHDHTAEPLWLALRAAGKTVVAATWPGADGATITAGWLPDPKPVLQAADRRTVDYTVPFGTFGGIGATGFTLTRVDFGPAPQQTIDQLKAAGKKSFSPVLQKTTPLETPSVQGTVFSIRVAALDTTRNGKTDYDTLVFFEGAQGIKPGPFAPPATGPAYVKARTRRSAPFYFEGTANRVGTAYYVSRLDPDLNAVHVARFAANHIPRNAPVLADVDDINGHVGFWAPQADFRIPERLSPGFSDFTDGELEAIYEDQVRLFVDYQTRVGLRALDRNPNADLVMIYIEQPDGSGHQFTLTDPRQATDPRDPNSIGAGQDKAKKARYARYLRAAYQAADNAVQRVIEKVGLDPVSGKPNSHIIVVSDHGMAPFHTAVNLANHLANEGIDPAKVRAVTSGPAANIYINLKGREDGGTVENDEYVELLGKIERALYRLRDDNAEYTRGSAGLAVFDRIYRRPLPARIDDPRLGRTVSPLIGQDSGDIYALLRPGYNFDGTQDPPVLRKGDQAAVAPQLPVLSVPNFYGAHGYAPEYPAMSAIFLAAGPGIGKGKLDQVHNIDVAPTILQLLGVAPAPTVEGKAIDLNGN